MIDRLRRVFRNMRGNGDLDAEMQAARREHESALKRANMALIERKRLDNLREDYARADAVLKRR